MACIFRLALATWLSCLLVIPVFAVSVQDEQGTFTLNNAPQRIVVLEFSFADALANIGISPVGIADDNDTHRMLSEVRERIGPYQSVGTRSQPNLEEIARLKPDLIIADSNRHRSIYPTLRRIAPTLLLKSRNETYLDNLRSAALIGKVVGKESAMQARLLEHQQRMQAIARQLPQGTPILFGISREDQFYLHTLYSYTGGVLTALGLKVLAPTHHGPFANISLEQLLAINPNWLIVAHYRQESIVHKWQSDPLWRVLKAAEQQHVASVDGNIWARMRGLSAAEYIAHNLVKILHTQPIPHSST